MNLYRRLVFEVADQKCTGSCCNQEQRIESNGYNDLQQVLGMLLL